MLPTEVLVPYQDGSSGSSEGINHEVVKNITVNLTPQYSPADDRMNNVDENNVDAYFEAALGRKMFLLMLTPYPEQYMSSSVVLF